MSACTSDDVCLQLIRRHPTATTPIVREIATDIDTLGNDLLRVVVRGIDGADYVLAKREKPRREDEGRLLDILKGLGDPLAEGRAEAAPRSVGRGPRRGCR